MFFSIHANVVVNILRANIATRYICEYIPVCDRSHVRYVRVHIHRLSIYANISNVYIKRRTVVMAMAVVRSYHEYHRMPMIECRRRHRYIRARWICPNCSRRCVMKMFFLVRQFAQSNRSILSHFYRI